jgi:uncharacterized membrane protein (UPF0182 family)
LNSFDKQWQRWFPEDSDKKSKSERKRRWTTKRILLILAGLLILFILLSIVKGFYTEWLWFSHLNYGAVFITVLRTKVLVFFISAIFFCALFLGNLLLATRLVPKVDTSLLPWAIVRRLQPILKRGIIIIAAILSIIFGLIAQSNWEVILRFFNWQPFGIIDPVFHKEIGFYVFSLPFLQALRGWLMGAFIVTLIGSLVVYIFSYAMQRLKFSFNIPVLAHVGGLFIAILGFIAWGYRLGIWELVFSNRGVVFGASYADMHAKLPAQWILLAIIIILMILILISAWRRKPLWFLIGIGVWIVASILIGGIYPALIQRFQVQPNELAREKPYIEYNIEFTREAFALNRIEEQPFPAEDMITKQDITQNDVTISNVRIWDYRPLIDTFNQIQSLRPYYDFNDVDIDRYTINGEYRQVMLSARELSAEKLPVEAQTWLNTRLLYTHGYGLTLSPVNEVDSQGLPVLLVKDIPPIGSFNIEQPGIYFGEKTNDYVIVKTKTQEFDYPRGDDNVYGSYQGKGGISLDSFIRRLSYAWEMGDINILISGELTADSRILYYRNIRDRVSHLAPFLMLDYDPYMVIMNGRLFWIQDAYTISDRYPYSTPTLGGLNYIRNSVKAVIDAYNGDITFYVADPSDAIIQTYQTIFPSLFVPMDQMPEPLKAHLRYPETMFNIQSSVYLSYHMQDFRVFYNKEDLWTIPNEVYFGSEQPVEAHYIIMRLPEEDKEEFLLILPFTPAKKNNTVGWLAGRCDGENYGKLIAYRFPKDKWVDGPSQVENRIGQDTVITEQLALWSRGGSQVIRGNLLLIPLGKSILWVEPVFLQAEGGGLPELKRVIVTTGDRIVMESTLAQGLASIFGSEALPAEPEVTPPVSEESEETIPTDIISLIEEAQQHYDKAQEYLKAGNWTGYGEELEALKAVLDRLAELVVEE